MQILKKLIILSICSIIIFSCDDSNSQSDYLEIFEEVWSRVNENYYDRDFRGKDWNKIGINYKTLIENSADDDEFFERLNSMLFELESSHFAVGPISAIDEAASPYMFKEGSIGIDVRIIDNEVVITKIEQNSHAELAGLKVGAIIKMINGIQIDSIINGTWLHPPFNSRCKKMSQTEEVVRKIYGVPESTVTINYLDENESKEVIIKRSKRAGMISINNIFNIYLEVEEKEISLDIGYIRFNAFQPDNPDRILAAFKRAKKYDGLLIDLRGNNGGSVAAMERIIGNLISERTQSFTLKGREGMEGYFIDPVDESYTGQIVILIDEMSVSGAENMAQILKNEDRATVIGTRTSGQLLFGDGSFINDSIILVIPIYQLIYPNGFIPEGEGITPDSVVNLNKEKLKKGIDLQLETAKSIIEKQLSKE